MYECQEFSSIDKGNFDQLKKTNKRLNMQERDNLLIILSFTHHDPKSTERTGITLNTKITDILHIHFFYSFKEVNSVINLRGSRFYIVFHVLFVTF